MHCKITIANIDGVVRSALKNSNAEREIIHITGRKIICLPVFRERQRNAAHFGHNICGRLRMVRKTNHGSLSSSIN